MAQTANERLFDETVRRRLYVLRYAEMAAASVARLLDEAEKELVGRIADALARGTNPARLEALLRSVKQQRDLAYEQVATRAMADLEKLALSEVNWERSLLQSVVPVELILADVAIEALRAAINTPISGLKLDRWLAGISAAELQQIERAIRLGVAQGETIDQMVARIRGTRDAFYQNGILSVSRRNAEALVRTAVNHVSNQARELVWYDAGDLIQALRWTSTLDGRTSDICRARDGHFAPLEGRELPEGLAKLIPPGARPPAHFNCRSVMVALLNGVALAGVRPYIADDRTQQERQAAFRAEARQRGVPVATVRQEWANRVVGQVPAETTYDQWLRRQSAAFQDDILGPARGRLFREGMTLDRFVDHTGRRVTLDELDRMRPAA